MNRSKVPSQAVEKRASICQLNALAKEIPQVLAIFMSDETEKAGEMANVLFQDVFECQKRLNAEDCQFWRRVYVRTVFASIEGLMSFLKLVATEEEVTASQSSKLRSKENIEFAYREFARRIDSTFVLDKNGKHWKALCSSLKVRNRLTHPKKLCELNVTEPELAAVKEVYSWICGTSFFELLNKSRKLDNAAQSKIIFSNV